MMIFISQDDERPSTSTNTTISSSKPFQHVYGEGSAKTERKKKRKGKQLRISRTGGVRPPTTEEEQMDIDVGTCNIIFMSCQHIL